MELTSIDSLFEEIKYLENKAKLLDEILRHYDKESMTFNIPEKWEGLNRIGKEELKKIPKSPRHALNKKIAELIPYEECEKLVNWQQVNDKAE